jgi:hypothetical protein
MLKRFGMTTVVLFVLGFGSASSSHLNAQAPDPGRGHDGTTDLIRVLSGIEEESCRARSVGRAQNRIIEQYVPCVNDAPTMNAYQIRCLNDGK